LLAKVGFRSRIRCLVGRNRYDQFIRTESLHVRNWITSFSNLNSNPLSQRNGRRATIDAVLDAEIRPPYWLLLVHVWNIGLGTPSKTTRVIVTAAINAFIRWHVCKRSVRSLSIHQSNKENSHQFKTNKENSHRILSHSPPF
jgi:hypothetical protein